MWLLFELGLLMSWILLPHRRTGASDKSEDGEEDQATS